MTRVWRLRFALCWFFVAIIVFIMRALPALSMSVWICWAFVAVDTWNCCTRFAVFVSVVVFVCVSVLVVVVVVVIVDVASLLLFFLLVSIMCSTCYARLTPSTPLSLSYLCSSSSSLCRWHFGFRRFSCNLPGKLLSTWATTTRFHFHSHSTIAFLLAWGSLPCPKNSARPLPASLPASCGVM